MERLWSYLRTFGKITKEMTPSHRVDTLTDALLYYAARVREKQAPVIQLCLQKVLKEETEAKEELMVLLNSIPGSTQSDVEVWTRQIKETLTDKRTLFLTWQERYVETLAEQHRVAKIKRTSDKQNKQQNNTYNGRNKSPQFPPRLEYVDVLQQDHPVWSQVSNSLGDSLLRAKQHAVMLHYISRPSSTPSSTPSSRPSSISSSGSRPSSTPISSSSSTPSSRPSSISSSGSRPSTTPSCKQIF
ncbi:unnamed protein product [Coregonus sp. 'balchen']|nr:unnamed protein product [Coregonus sp. 'balchen']